jgi:hypothetical protein
MLERGSVAMPALPSVPALLRAACGAAAEPLVVAYTLLRRAEASARWLAGRAVEAIDADGLGPVAELCEPGLGARDFRSRLEAARRDVRAAYDRVIAAGSVAALGQ